MQTISVRLQDETLAQLIKVPVGTVSHQSQKIGIERAEPLLVAMDGLIRYAKAHKRQYESILADDYVLGPEWLSAVKGIRGLLNGNGAVANELGRSTDSKDNGAIEGMFWNALKIAGYTEADL